MRIAALDMGSNSFHLLVVESEPGGSFATVLRDKDMLHLGAVVQRHGGLPPAEADRAVRSVARLKALADSAGAALVTGATGALRRARNGTELLGRIAAETGVDVRLLSGDEEGRLVFDAVRRDMALGAETALCLDLGGGSLEIVVGDRSGPLQVGSVDLGVSRLAAEVGRRRLAGSTARRLEKRARSALEPLAGHVREVRPSLAVATGGTARHLARLASGRPEAGRHRRVQRQQMQALRERLCAGTAVPGLDPVRATTAPVGAVVLDTAMDVFGVDELAVCRWGLREGMVLEALAG